MSHSIVASNLDLDLADVKRWLLRLDHETIVGTCGAAGNCVVSNYLEQKNTWHHVAVSHMQGNYCTPGYDDPNERCKAAEYVFHFSGTYLGASSSRLITAFDQLSSWGETSRVVTAGEVLALPIMQGVES